MSVTSKSPSNKPGHYQQFKIDGLEYALTINPSGTVWLDLRGGMTKKGTANRNPCEDLYWDEPNFDDVDLGINTFKVFNTARRILLNYVFTRRPFRIRFSASTERKVRVYRWMAWRLARKLKKYNMVEYPPGEFNFYKQVRSA